MAKSVKNRRKKPKKAISAFDALDENDLRVLRTAIIALLEIYPKQTTLGKAQNHISARYEKCREVRYSRYLELAIHYSLKTKGSPWPIHEIKILTPKRPSGEFVCRSNGAQVLAYRPDTAEYIGYYMEDEKSHNSCIGSGDHPLKAIKKFNVLCREHPEGAAFANLNAEFPPEEAKLD